MLADPTRPPINRALMTSDLANLAVILAPLVEARLPAGAAELMALSGLPPVSALLTDSLLKILDLDDTELGPIIDALAIELGAWRGVRSPLGTGYLADHPELTAAGRRLLEVIT